MCYYQCSRYNKSAACFAAGQWHLYAVLWYIQLIYRVSLLILTFCLLRHIDEALLNSSTTKKQKEHDFQP